MADENTNFKNIIAQRVKEDFAKFIPDTDWEDLVEREVRMFVTETSTAEGKPRKLSEFGKIVNNMLHNVATARLEKLIPRLANKVDFEAVTKKYIDENLETFIRSWLAECVKNLIGNMASQVSASAMSANVVIANATSATGFKVCPHCGSTFNPTIHPQPMCCGNMLY